MNSVTSNAVAKAIKTEALSTGFRYNSSDFNYVNQWWFRLSSHVYLVSGNFIATRDFANQEKLFYLPEGINAYYRLVHFFNMYSDEKVHGFLNQDYVEISGTLHASVEYIYEFIIVAR